MKIRTVKLSPETLIKLLQGKASAFSNLPADTELLDLKLDLFSRQVSAVVRSDSFEDVPESASIPELTLTSVSQPIHAAPPAAVLPQPKPSVAKAVVQPSKTIFGIENEFTSEQRKLLSFTVKGDVVVVKPVTFLKAEWDDINDVVRSVGGRWVKGDILSYWEVPAQ
jgi:hypothetical protein